MINRKFWRVKKTPELNFINPTGDEHLDMDFYDAFFYRNAVNYRGPVYPNIKNLSYSWQEEARAKADIIWSPALLSVFFCNTKTSRTLSSVLKPSCDRWKVPCGSEMLDMHIVAHELDGFDYKRSSYETDPDFKEINRINRYVLKKGFETELDIFRLKGAGASLRMTLIVSDRFRKVFVENGLTGMEFISISNVETKSFLSWVKPQ